MSSNTSGGHNRCCGPSSILGANRRGFLTMGLSGFATLSLPGLLRLQSAIASDQSSKPRERKSIIMVWKPGGCSHIDTYDPKPDATSEYRGPFSTISTKVPGMLFTELLPRQAAIADK
ncbi:MAG: DUF1501 domain-containing protein, partial [Pirellula sp.]